jgi:hypothetical protein
MDRPEQCGLLQLSDDHLSWKVLEVGIVDLQDVQPLQLELKVEVLPRIGAQLRLKVGLRAHPGDPRQIAGPRAEPGAAQQPKGRVRIAGGKR